MIIEDIGSRFFLFPEWTICDPSIHALRCYEDSNLGFYQVDPNIGCDSIIYVKTEEHTGIEIHVSPNPFNSVLSVTMNSNINNTINFVIYDTMGREVMNVQEQKSTGYFRKDIDAELLPDGIYLLVIEMEGQRHIEKILKG